MLSQSELASLWGKFLYLGNDFSNRPLTQRAVFSRYNSPLAQHVISICACITLRKVLISRKRLHQSNSNSARCVQHVQYTIDAACYLKSELASLLGNVWYLGNDFSNRPLTQRVVFSKSNPPLTQHVISIWALHHSEERFDISETTAPIDL